MKHQMSKKRKLADYFATSSMSFPSVTNKDNQQ